LTVNRLNKKTVAIMQAIHRAGKPLKCSEIAERTGIHLSGVGNIIRWRMLNTLVQVDHEEREYPHYSPKYYSLTIRGKAKLEAPR